jgi:hypothetical protein
MECGQTREQMLGTLINEVPAEMREGDNRVRKLHEALVRLRVELRFGGALHEPVSSGRTSSSKQRWLRWLRLLHSQTILFSAANLPFSGDLFGVAHLLNHVSTVTEECARMVSFYLREAQWQ